MISLTLMKVLKMDTDIDFFKEISNGCPNKRKIKLLKRGKDFRQKAKKSILTLHLRKAISPKLFPNPLISLSSEAERHQLDMAIVGKIAWHAFLHTIVVHH